MRWISGLVLVLLSVSLPVAAADDLKVGIHNGLISAPNGIAFVVADQAAFVVDVKPEVPPGKKGPPYVPGMTAPDDSIHKSVFTTDAATIRFDWGKVGDAVVARCTADHPAHVVLSLLDTTWPGFVTHYTATPDGVTGQANLAEGKTINWRLRIFPVPLSNDGKTIILNVDPDHPARWVAGLGNLPAVDGIDQTLAAAEQAYLRTRPLAAGSRGDFLGAISDNMNNSRCYSSDNHLLAHTVARAWGGGDRGNNAVVYFCWDSFFNGLLACLDDPDGARTTVRAVLSCQTDDGFIPNYGHWNLKGKTTSLDRSQPPVGSMCIWKMHQRWPDDEFLREVYPKLVRWHDWWPRARDGQHDGLLEWGSTNAGWQGARLETGWDDTLAFNGGKMVGQTMNVYAVDLCSMWSADAEYLALIADAIGQPTDAARFRAEHQAMNQRINDKLWNEAAGMYCNRLWDQDGKPGTFLTRYSPMNFYPMICGAPDADRAKRILAMLTDPKKFWGQWMVPTLAYDDPGWTRQQYWHGKVWGPVNYLLFQGLKRYASPQIQAELADKSVTIFMQNWTARGVCGENFLSTTGQQSSEAHYTWGALMCLIGLESVVDQTPDGKIITGQNPPADIDLKHIQLNGKRYHVTVQNGQVQLAEEH